MRFALASTFLVALATAAVSSASNLSQPSLCANIWNHSAPAALRAKIAAHKPRAAFISPRTSVTTYTWTKTSQSSLSASACSIHFVLRDGTLAVWGKLEGGHIARWLGPVPSKRPIRAPNNSSVHADGTVGYHG
jgi:hypothetical protein